MRDTNMYKMSIAKALRIADNARYASNRELGHALNALTLINIEGCRLIQSELDSRKSEDDRLSALFSEMVRA